MPGSLKPYFNSTLRVYQTEYANGHLNEAWTQLGRAHIIGQNYPNEHTLVHWKMLRFGIRIKSWKEILGQIPRLIFGGAKFFVGKIPKGNPGGAIVSPLKPFPINEDLKDVFIKAGIHYN